MEAGSRVWKRATLVGGYMELYSQVVTCVYIHLVYMILSLHKSSQTTSIRAHNLELHQTIPNIKRWRKNSNIHA